MTELHVPPNSDSASYLRFDHTFPTPPRGFKPDASLRINGRTSPAPGKLLSMTIQRAQSTPPETTNNNSLRGSGRRAKTGLLDVASLEESWQTLSAPTANAQYFSEAFAYREPNNTAKERIARDSVVMAEVKLNCCLESEHAFMTDLSFRLSAIYQRSASCIMVMVVTEVAMLIGGNMEPAYHITITALPAEIQATKNKRSTHLIQDFMQDALAISAKRGILRFEAVLESNLATNGMTALQEIEHLESSTNNDEGILRTISRQKSKRSKNSSMPIFTDRGKTPTPLPRSDTPSRFSTKLNNGTKSASLYTPEVQRVKKRKSIMNFFRK